MTTATHTIPGTRAGAAAPAAPADHAAARLAVTRLDLCNFRNCASLRLEVEARPVVLTGPNGAGKTSLLEALSFLAPGRGLRHARASEVGRLEAGGGGWTMAARIASPDGQISLGTGRDPDGGQAARRLVRVNGTPARAQAALAECLSVVWLTPEMDRLFEDGAATRRRFFDRLVVGLDPAHAGRVQAYDRALRERARLLRDGARDPAWLDALEERMATEGVAIAAARREAAARLDALARDVTGPFPGAALAIEGEVEAWLDDRPALAAEDRLRQALAASRARDAEAGGAGHGPHRSDLRVRHLAMDRAAALCSTGEQKALLVAIVLAHARLLAAARGAAPVLLLDEVAAHLDEVCRRALFERLAELGVQAWLTGTDAGLFAPLGAWAQFLTVAEAAVAA